MLKRLIRKLFKPNETKRREHFKAVLKMED